jgi:hypothetical protein
MTGLPGHDSGIRRAMDKVARAGSWYNTARTGQTGQDRTSWAGHLGQGNWGQARQDMSDWTSRPERNMDRTART